MTALPSPFQPAETPQRARLVSPGDGSCAVCGWTGALNTDGAVRGHNEWRIGRKGKPYRSNTFCDGSHERPEPEENPL